MPGRLSDRLREAGRRLFVGREAQRDLFERVLQEAEASFSLLHVYGPGGIGKTSLLYAFQRICRDHAVPFVYLDARTVQADPVAFRSALCRELALPEGAVVEEIIGADGRFVLMIDTFEMLQGLEQWLFNAFFTALHEQVFIVIAGRLPLAAAWSNHPGWGSLIRTVPLRNLTAGESKTFLERAGMPERYHQPVIEYTHGHPLALSLIAETFVRNPEASFNRELGADFIKALMDRFLRDAPGPRHRQALEASALVNHLTESLLAALLACDDASDLFEWLRRLSFMESGARGIFPHDLARDVISAELRWRNPDRYRLFHERARAYYNAHLQDAPPDEQSTILMDYIYLHRDNPIVQPFFTTLQARWQDGVAPVSSDRYTPADEATVAGIVERHEGRESARLVRRWLERQPATVVIYRDAAGDVAGFLLLLALHEADPEDLAEDPVAHACRQWLDREAPLRPGERATLFRFWMDAGKHHQLSRVQSHIFVDMVRHYLTTPGLAYTFLPIAHPDFYSAIFAYADLYRLEALDFSENGMPFGVFGHDWRRRPPAAWLDLLASREIGGKPEPNADAVDTRRVLVLSEEAFGEATRSALRAYSRPSRMKNNPLLSSRIVVDRVDARAGDEERIEALKALIEESVEQLKNNPRSEKAYRAIDRTYLRPAPSQEVAAELLNLPYSTFRRHLARGVREITTMLWEKEIGI